MIKTFSSAPLSFDRTKLRSLIRHFGVRLVVVQSDGAPWVGDAALMQVVHHGTSILIPGGSESALFLLARTFIAIETLAATIGVVPDDEANLAAEPGTPAAQLVLKFVSDMTAVRDAKSLSDVARHLSSARAALARVSAVEFDLDLVLFIRETAGRLPNDN